MHLNAAVIKETSVLYQVIPSQMFWGLSVAVVVR